MWERWTPKGKSLPRLHLSGRGHLSGWTWVCNEVNDVGREGGREEIQRGRVEEREREEGEKGVVGVLEWG